MKRLSLLTFTMMLAMGCQRSEANPLDAALPTAVDTGDNSVTRLTSCHKADEWACAVETAITEKTNQKRSGLTSLKQSFETSYVARVHSQGMMSRGRADHDGFGEGHREDTLQKEFAGLRIKFLAENVAWVSRDIADPEAVAEEFVKMWWNSAGHRRNMLGDRYRYIGVGVVHSDRGIYVTQIFH